MLENRHLFWGRQALSINSSAKGAGPVPSTLVFIRASCCDLELPWILVFRPRTAGMSTVVAPQTLIYSKEPRESFGMGLELGDCSSFRLILDK